MKREAAYGCFLTTLVSPALHGLADYKSPGDWSTFPPTPSKLVCATPDRLQELYSRQKNVPEYKRLLESNVTIFGTYDDHDYGCNNADQTYEFRHESGVAYTDFLELPQDSAMSRRAHAGRGVYGVKLFDFARPEGQQEVDDGEAAIDPDALVTSANRLSPAPYSDKSVAVFVLDIRANKTPWKTGSRAFFDDHEGDFLGEEQWEWFETAIRRSRASVNVVVSGIQVLGSRFPHSGLAEDWTKFPAAQARLIDALMQEGVNAPVIISGDVHMTQLMQKDCVRRDDLGAAPRSIVEMTTSGMTHSWGTISSPPLSNPNLPPTWLERYQSFLSASLMHVLHFACPWKDLMISDNSMQNQRRESRGKDQESIQGLQYSLEKNVGEIEVDWEGRTVTLRSMGEDKHAPPLLTAKFGMDQLSGETPIRNSHLSRRDFEYEAGLKVADSTNEWVCINHRGRDSPLKHSASLLAAGIGMAFISLLPMMLLSALFLPLFLLKRRRSRSTIGR